MLASKSCYFWYVTLAASVGKALMAGLHSSRRYHSTFHWQIFIHSHIHSFMHSCIWSFISLTFLYIYSVSCNYFLVEASRNGNKYRDNFITTASALIDIVMWRLKVDYCLSLFMDPRIYIFYVAFNCMMSFNFSFTLQISYALVLNLFYFVKMFLMSLWFGPEHYRL